MWFMKTLMNKMLVMYLCDPERNMCWLDGNPGSFIKFVIPVKNLRNGRLPVQVRLDEISGLLSKENFFRYVSNSLTEVNPKNLTTKPPSSSTPIVHKRRKRSATVSFNKDDNFQQGSKMSSDVGRSAEWRNQPIYSRENSWREQRDISQSKENEQITDEHTEEIGQASQDSQAPKQQVKRSAPLDEDNKRQAPLDEDNNSQTSDSTDANYNSEEFSTAESSAPQRRPIQHNDRYRALANEDDDDESEMDPTLFLSKVDPLYKTSRADGLSYRSPSDTDAGMYYNSISDDSYPSRSWSYGRPYYPSPSYFQLPAYNKYPQSNSMYYGTVSKAMPSYKKSYGKYGYKPPPSSRISDMYYG
ncbi:hypothetical protein NPIL_227111 [Nephila pilipes]|uniref:Uncharacterized protein n=1 Tax=Nephila pilipes TaxID=299642 RepID=A0A8X6TCD3_NEPPI|nr:hypothetical protein NPIL_227111 [Nephila pilipes]